MTSIPEAAHRFNIFYDAMIRSFGFGEVEGNEKTQVSYLVTSALGTDIGHLFLLLNVVGITF